ncbi:hypothetical protein [Lysobacter sp. Hz 25]|uniref:hypothetical protein n=1 Tax=Lysobacter sp. Hz 25 TaxID=3383698 RepID=UPI0038D4B715
MHNNISRNLAFFATLAWLMPHPSLAALSALGTLGGNLCMAIDVNNEGAAVGKCRTPAGDIVPTYWASGSSAAMALPGLEVDGPCSVVGIGGSNAVAGNCELGADGERFPVRWLTPSLPSAVPQILNARTGHDRAEAQLMNQAGSVAGISTDPDGTDHPVLWKNGQTNATALPVPGLLPPLLSPITDCHITSMGHAATPALVGYCDLRYGGTLAVKWTPNAIGGYNVASLPRIPGGSNCVAIAVNPNGYAAGTCEDTVGDLAAVRWNPSGGAPAMLRGLPREAAVGQQVFAADMNSAGTITGNYTATDGTTRSFVWAPTDDPDSEDGLDLGTPDGDTMRAERIADNGYILGSALDAQGGNVAVLWTLATNLQTLGTLGGPYNRPVAISPNGAWIVGTSEISTRNQHAYRVGSAQVGGTSKAKGFIGLAGAPIESNWCATLGKESTDCPDGF